MRGDTVELFPAHLEDRAWRFSLFGDELEAIHEFEVKDMPVTVAVDSTGDSVHTSGPKEWRIKIGKIPVTAA